MRVGFMQVQGGAKGERLVTAIADKPMKLTDTATKVRLTPDLEGKARVDEILTIKMEV